MTIKNWSFAPAMAGALAGMAIGNQLKMFFKQGWKLITIPVMTGALSGRGPGGAPADPCRLS